MAIQVQTQTGVPLEAKLTLTPASIGGVRLFSENDAGTKTLVPYLKSPETSPDFRLRTGRDTLLFEDVFNGITQNVLNWKHLFTTMTATMGSGSILFNANLSAGATVGALLQTWQHFSIGAGQTLYWEAVGQITALPQANQNYSAGLGVGATATAEPTDGIFFRLNAGGLYGIVKNNGTETVAQLLSTGPVAAENSKYVIIVNQREIEWWVDDVLLAETACPDAYGMFGLATAYPAFAMQFNAGLVSGAPQMQVKLSGINVSIADMDLARPYGQQLAGMGRAAYRGQNGGTLGSTALFANSANPTAAVPTNTTAALGVGLGGHFRHTNTLAVTPVDGIVCSFQNPVGGVNQTPRNLLIFGVAIDTAVGVTLANAGGAVYVYSLAYGHTAIAMNTTQSGSFANNTAVAPIRVGLGVQGAVGALVQGSVLTPVVRRFDGAPIVVPPGMFVAVVVKNVGTVGTAGQLEHVVTFDAAFE